jgi:hypothetical protein
MSPRWNWDSPTPFVASECALPPGPKGGGGAHSPAAKGVGKSQFQRLEKRLALCLLWAFSHLQCNFCQRKLQLLPDVLEVVCSALLVPATWEVTNGKQFQFAHLLALNPHLLLWFRLAVWQWKITKFLFVFVLYRRRCIHCSAGVKGMRSHQW